MRSCDSSLTDRRHLSGSFAILYRHLKWTTKSASWWESDAWYAFGLKNTWLHFRVILEANYVKTSSITSMFITKFSIHLPLRCLLGHLASCFTNVSTAAGAHNLGLSASGLARFNILQRIWRYLGRHDLLSGDGCLIYKDKVKWQSRRDMPLFLAVQIAQ